MVALSGPPCSDWSARALGDAVLSRTRSSPTVHSSERRTDDTDRSRRGPHPSTWAIRGAASGEVRSARSTLLTSCDPKIIHWDVSRPNPHSYSGSAVWATKSVALGRYTCKHTLRSMCRVLRVAAANSGTRESWLGAAVERQRVWLHDVWERRVCAHRQPRAPPRVPACADNFMSQLYALP